MATDADVATPHAADPGAATRLCRRLGWRRLRIAAVLIWVASVVAAIATLGLPTDTRSLAEIILPGLLITGIGRGWRRAGQVLLDWLPFVAVLLLYNHTRSIAGGLGVPVHEADVLHAEKWLFGGVEPTVWLQRHLYDPHQVRWYDVLCTLVYTSHFLATPILAAVLWLRDRTAWLHYVVRVIVLSVLALATYILFPEAPPWLAARDGLSPPVARLSPRGWEFLSDLHLNDTLARAQADGSNPVAAMPSLHTALATLVAITLMAQIRSRWRWLLVLYPLAMAFTLVYTGEHYVLDLVAGVLYTLVVHAGVSRWEARRDRMRAADTDTSGVPV